MNEHLPSSGDNYTPAVSPEWVDMPSSPQWVAFMAKVNEVERDLAIYYDQDELDEQRVPDMLNELQEAFDLNYIQKQCLIQGRVFQSSAELEQERAEPELRAVQARYFGCSLSRIGGLWRGQWRVRWRVLLEFVQDSDQATDARTATYYVRPGPEHLQGLRIDSADNYDEDVELDITDILVDQFFAAREWAHEANFSDTQQTNNQKRDFLERKAEKCTNDIEEYVQMQTVRTFCRSFYTAYDDMKGVELNDFTDQSAAPFDEIRYLDGRITGMAYPEIDLLPPDAVITKDIFINEGAPCLVMRSDELEQTYYILPQSVAAVYNIS